MPLTLTRSQVREVDRRAIADYGMSGLVLMENAGRGATDLLCRLLQEPSPSGRGQVEGSPWRGEGAANLECGNNLTRTKVAIVCGKGNNGGDGFVIARHLDLREIGVRTLLLADPRELTGDAAANFHILEKAGVPIEIFGSPLDPQRFDGTLSGAAWLVDALLGTGAAGEPKSPYAEAIDRMNASHIPILAIDLPSGLDCDTGAAATHTIRATTTCTFVAPKPGFFTRAAAPYIGQLHIQDIGVPRKLLSEVVPRHTH